MGNYSKRANHPDPNSIKRADHPDPNSIKHVQRANHLDPKYCIALAVVGLSGSGINTFRKQMRILHLGGFTDEEKRDYKRVLEHNILCTIKTLIQQAKIKGIEMDNKESCKILSEINPYETNLTPELVLHIKTLWNNVYCMGIIDNLVDPQYTVSNEDILNARLRTTGTAETEFNIGGRFTWVLVDFHLTLGQSRGRRYHHMERIAFSGVIFFAALDEWDVISSYDPSRTNLDLFEKLQYDVFCGELPLILVLNKKDAFKDKILWNDLSRVYPEYKGGSDVNQGIEFIKNLYLARRDPTRQMPAVKSPFGNEFTRPVPIETYITCALDTQEMKQLMDSIDYFIIKSTSASA